MRSFIPIICVATAAPLLATSSAWTTFSVRHTGVRSNTQSGVWPVAALSVSGQLYSAVPGPCSSPTITLGSGSDLDSCIAAFDSSGQQIFAVQIAAHTVQNLVLDPSGDLYLAGEAGPGVIGLATAGVYEPSPPGVPDPFVCRLGGVNGQPVFCTFVDVRIAPSGFAVDVSGNSYLAGMCSSAQKLCVEKLNATGTAEVYNVGLAEAGFATLDPPYIAADANGNLFIAQSGFGLIELNASGAVAASPIDFGDGVPVALAVDPYGDPQLLVQSTANDGQLDLVRYSSTLSTVLFDAPFTIGSAPARNSSGFVLAAMAIDSTGATVILSGGASADLPPIHPTQSCAIPSTAHMQANSAILARFDNAGNQIQSTYLHLPPTFSPQTSIVFDSSGAVVPIAGEDWEVLQLGPASSDVDLSCIGNAMSLWATPLAPNEIVSLFGAGLSGSQVTFDGVPASILYSSDNQIILMAPGELRDKTITHICAVSSCIDVPVQPAAPGIVTSEL